MALNRPISSEKELLKLIEDPKAKNSLTSGASKAKRRSRPLTGC